MATLIHLKEFGDVLQMENEDEFYERIRLMTPDYGDATKLATYVKCTPTCVTNWKNGERCPDKKFWRRFAAMGFLPPVKGARSQDYEELLKVDSQDTDFSETIPVNEPHVINLTDEELDIVASAMDSMFYEPNSFYTTKLMISVYDKLMKAGWDPNKLSKEMEAERRFWDERLRTQTKKKIARNTPLSRTTKHYLTPL